MNATEELPVATPVKEEPRYKMPKAVLHRTVVFRAGGDHPSMPGVAMVVTQTGEFAISGNLIIKDKMTVLPVNGVRHISDPDARFFEQSGTWEDTDDQKQLDKILKSLGE